MTDINLDVKEPILIYGEKGLSITSASMNGNDLEITLSDASTVTVAGAKGDKGDIGLGIQSAEINGTGHLVVTLTDNSTITSTNPVRGTKGDTGTAGASVDGGNVANNQITLTRDDGSTINLTGTINAATEETGDLKISARNDISSLSYYQPDDNEDITLDKANYPGLHSVLKVVNDQSRFDFGGVDAGEHYYKIQTCQYTGQNFTVKGIYKWGNKWIRNLLTTDTLASGNYYICLQVSDTFDFTTFDEYIIEHTLIQSSVNSGVSFLPEVGKIIFSESRGYIVLSGLNTDLSNLNDFNVVGNGGLGNPLTKQLDLYNEFGTYHLVKNLCFDRPVSDPNCKAMISTGYNRNEPQVVKWFITDVSNIENIFDATPELVTDVETELGVEICTDHKYYHHYLANPVFSNNRVFFQSYHNGDIYSLDITTRDLKLEIDYYTTWSVNADFQKTKLFCTDGAILLALNNTDAQTEPALYTKKWDHTSFTVCNLPNDSGLSKMEWYNPDKDIIIIRMGNHEPEDATPNYVTFDGGITWRQFAGHQGNAIDYTFFETYNVARPYSFRLMDKENYIFWEQVDNGSSVYADLQWDYLEGAQTLVRLIEPGESDLFTVKSFYINGQLKPYIKR